MHPTGKAAGRPFVMGCRSRARPGARMRVSVPVIAPPLGARRHGRCVRGRGLLLGSCMGRLKRFAVFCLLPSTASGEAASCSSASAGVRGASVQMQISVPMQLVSLTALLSTQRLSRRCTQCPVCERDLAWSGVGNSNAQVALSIDTSLVSVGPRQKDVKAWHEHTLSCMSTSAPRVAERFAARCVKGEREDICRPHPSTLAEPFPSTPAEMGVHSCKLERLVGPPRATLADQAFRRGSAAGPQRGASLRREGDPGRPCEQERYR